MICWSASCSRLIPSIRCGKITGFRVLVLVAEAGDANSMFNLGVMYANGEGVAKDDAEAVRWYRKAADLGNRHAIRRLKGLGK